MSSSCFCSSWCICPWTNGSHVSSCHNSSERIRYPPRYNKFSASVNESAFSWWRRYLAAMEPRPGGCHHLPFEELSPTTKVNLQRRLYCLTCLSGSATVVLLDICFGRKQPSATSFVSLIILVWWTGISSSAVSPGIGPYPLYKDMLEVSNLSDIAKSLLVKFSLRGLSTPDGPRFPTHPLFPWGLIIFSSHLVPCSCFTIWLENLSWSRNQL